MDSPWSNEATLCITNKIEKLSKEILDFEKYISPTKTEQLNRDTLLYQITQLINSRYPNATVVPFGSTKTGLQFPTSDIDINIDFGYEVSKKERVSILYLIRKKSCNEDIFRFNDTNVVGRAKVPVFTAVNENNVSVDITVQTACYSSNRTIIWLKEYEVLKPLFMVLKQSLSHIRISGARQFNVMSSKHNGLASYALICMIVSYLQLQSSKLDPSKPDYIGQVLLGFLDFYSTFDNENQFICLKDGGRYYTKRTFPTAYSRLIVKMAQRLVILDPDEEDTNVSRSVSKFDLIQLAISSALKLLRERIHSEDSEIGSILSAIIKVDHHDYKEPRKEGKDFRATEIRIGSSNGGGGSGGSEHKKHGHTLLHKAGEKYHKRVHRHDQRTSPYKKHRHYYSDDEEEEVDRYRQKHKKREHDNYNRREYERHKKKNNTHLAAHYRKKANRY